MTTATAALTGEGQTSGGDNTPNTSNTSNTGTPATGGDNSDGGAGGQPSAPANANNEPAAKWYGNIEDNDLKAYADNKGWGSAKDALEGYRNLEKLVGTEKLPMPKDENDTEGWNKVFKQLGRPDNAAEYNLPVPEGADSGFAKEASEKFHELGLSRKQATALTEWWNGTAAAEAQASQNRSELEVQKDMDYLQARWGESMPVYEESGRRALKNLKVDMQEMTGVSLDDDDLPKIESAIGTRKMMALFAAAGKPYQEARFHEGGGSGQFSASQDGAKAEIQQLKNDKDFQRKLSTGDSEATAKWNKLHRQAYL